MDTVLHVRRTHALFAATTAGLGLQKFQAAVFTGIPGWPDLSTTDYDPCNLDGITCTSSGVTKMSLPSYGLRNDQPLTGLDDLVNLETLKLQQQLTGPLPDLQLLTKLVTLDLSGNTFTGPIPSTWGSLTALQDIRLVENQLSGPLPSTLSKLVNLKIM
eukprot:jgi/Chlat1/2544/Chrsp175S02390